MQNRVNDVEEEPHLMSVIVLLILSASAIAMPPSGPSLLYLKLQNEGRGNKKLGAIINKKTVVVEGQARLT